jgi:hypothetical protein
MTWRDGRTSRDRTSDAETTSVAPAELCIARGRTVFRRFSRGGTLEANPRHELQFVDTGVAQKVSGVLRMDAGFKIGR